MKCSCCGSEKCEEVSLLSHNENADGSVVVEKTDGVVSNFGGLLTSYICLECGHVEFFSPVLKQRLLDKITEEEKRKAALSAEEKRHEEEQQQIKDKIADLKAQLAELNQELADKVAFADRDDITVREQKKARNAVDSLRKQIQVIKFTIGKWNKKICEFDPNSFTYTESEPEVSVEEEKE